MSPFKAEPFESLAKSDHPLALSTSTQWFRVDLVPYRRYQLTLTTSSELPAESRAGAISYRFIDSRGRRVQSGAVTKPNSPDLGYFDFIPRVPVGATSDYLFFSPGEALFVDLGFRLWKGDAPIELDAVAITDLGRRTAVRAYDISDELRPRHSLRMAVVADKFTVTALERECDVLPLSSSDWRSEIAEFAPDMLMIESAWNGNDGDWLYCVYRVKESDRRLRDLVEHAQANDIPVVFWNKEDPAHYDDFIEAARLCDYVATTDSLLLDQYKAELGHDRVFALPFCIQPDIHNPRRAYDVRGDRIEAACFLGSWWSEKFDDRRSSQLALFEGSTEYGLEIYDRYFTWHEHERYRIPQPWMSFVHGSLDYEQAISAYRMYRVVLNVNTITTSPTMFSRRALEAAACGAAVITNKSDGTDEAFGSLIDSVTTAEDCAKALEKFAARDSAVDIRTHQAFRHVHTEHTWANRLADLGAFCSIPVRQRRRQSIAVVLATMRPDGARRILEWLGSVDQTDFDLSAIIVTSFDPALIEEALSLSLKDVIVHQQGPDETLGECLNYGALNARADFVAKIDDDDYYGPNYFSDLLLAANFSRADIVGKQSHLEWFESIDATILRYPGAEHRFTTFVCGSTLLIRAAVFESVLFPRRRVGEDTVFLNRAHAVGLKTYSSDPYNYVSVRRSDLTLHTWQATDDELINGSESRRYAEGIAYDALNA